MKNFSLLVLDDDTGIRDILNLSLSHQWELHFYSKPSEAPTGKKFDAALIDMHLSDNFEKTEGLEFIKKCHSQDPHLEIIAISGDLNPLLMEKALRAGASRYLAKPLNINEVELILKKIENLLLLKRALSGRSQLNSQWIGESKSSQKIKKQIADYAQEDFSLLIEGDSGTGKEVVAQLLHQSRPEVPFVAVNVAAINENLFESEFFGHVKGAFTGASHNKMGLAEVAHGGDLFLDEIEALSLNMQAKLLRFIESGEIRRVGASSPIQVKCRIIAATNKSLEKMVREKEFREDLMWRLKGSSIVIPPLRERKEDIPLLLKHFISQDRNRKKSFSSESLQALTEYSWPGNVRELKQFCNQAIALSPLPTIRKEDISSLLNTTIAIQKNNEDIDFSQGLTHILNKHEQRIIQTCLNKQNNIDEVARLLKISRSSLYKKIKDHNINWRQ